MSTENIIAEAHIDINAGADNVWDALVDPKKIKKYMFGATVTSGWLEGSGITWKGEIHGKQYEDKGTIVQMKPAQLLQYTHYSPLSKLPDIPENYHSVTIELTPKENITTVTLSQDNNKTEKEKEESQKNWQTMLEGLKKVA